MFRTLPKAALVETSLGPHPIPYTVSEGHAVLLTGVGDLGSVRTALAGEDVHAVATENGDAALGLFICRFDAARSGPHLELHYGALVAPEPGQTISDEPEAFLAGFATRPDWGFLSLALFNDTPATVALNTEYFGLGARLMQGRIEVVRDMVAFDLSHPDGAPLASGTLARRVRPEPGAFWRLLRLMGWRAVLSAARAPWAEAHVINRKCPEMPTNRRARTMTAADEMAVMRWRDARDSLRLALPHAFRPTAMQHLHPFRFAYLHPDTAGAAT
jgi:hypothetical protein